MFPDTVHRDAASLAARTDLAEAMRQAMQIKSAWFRCQALAHIALHTSDGNARDALIAEAFVEGHSLGEPNRMVSVSSWPLKVAALFWEDMRLQPETDRLLAIILTEPSPVRRANALMRMINALAKRPAVHGAVLEALVEACFAPLVSGRHNKRGESYFLEIIPLLLCHDPARARECCYRLASEYKRGLAFKTLEKSQGVTFETLSDCIGLPVYIR